MTLSIRSILLVSRTSHLMIVILMMRDIVAAYIAVITTIVDAPGLFSVLVSNPLPPPPPARRRTRFPDPIDGGVDFPRVLAVHEANVSAKSRGTGQTRRRFTSACSHKYLERQRRDFTRLNTRCPDRAEGSRRCRNEG